MRPFLTLAMLLLALPAGGAPEDDYAARAAKLGDRKQDAKGWLGLADFCEEHLLWDRRAEALRKAVSADPDNAEAHARLDEKRYGKEWLPAEEAEAREAEENLAKGLVFYGAKWVPPKEADRLREADCRTAGWKVLVRVDTPHLKVYSARPLDFTLRMTGLLENELVAYRKFFGKTWKLAPNPGSFTVHLFADRETYERVARANGVQVSDGDVAKYHVHHAALYVGVNIPAVVPPDSPDEILEFAAHEMLHGLDDLLGHCTLGCPAWRQEGCATYFAHCIRGRQVLPGVFWAPAADGYPAYLEKALASCKLPEVMALSQAKFMETLGCEHYALSWAFVHFLFHGEGGKHAAAFRKYLATCDTKPSNADFEKAVGSLSELEPVFRDYVEKEFLPAVQAGRAPPAR